MQKFSPVQVGHRIRMVRARMTQTDFAKALGVHKQNYISRYERGRVPSPDLLIRIAEHGRVTLDWLLTGKGGKKSGARPKKASGRAGKKAKRRR